MWWDWRKSSRLYIGKALVLLQLPRQPIHVVAAGDADLAGTLANVRTQLPAGARLHVDLGVERCMAVPVRYPQGLRGFEEKRQVAQAVSASALGLSAEQVHCELDPLQPGVAAAASAADIIGLQTWASASGIQLLGIRPWWSVVSTDTNRAPGMALVIREPGGTTVLGQRDALAAWRGFSLVPQDGAGNETDWREMLDSVDLPVDGAKVVTITDHADLANPQSGLPNLWPGHLRLMA